MKKLFMEWIDKIEDAKLKKVAKKMAKELPDYFWHIPASSSGKYHPECDLGDGGLVRHSIMVCQIALDFVTNEMFVRNAQVFRDMAIVASLFHDGFKSGLVDENGNYSDHTVFEHPRIASDFVRKHLEDANIDPVKVEMICSAIYTHMGIWCVDVYGEKKGNPQKALSKPRTDFEKLIHNADYMASRKYIKGIDDFN